MPAGARLKFRVRTRRDETLPLRRGVGVVAERFERERVEVALLAAGHEERAAADHTLAEVFELVRTERLDDVDGLAAALVSIERDRKAVPGRGVRAAAQRFAICGDRLVELAEHHVRLG